MKEKKEQAREKRKRDSGTSDGAPFRIIAEEFMNNPLTLFWKRN